MTAHVDADEPPYEVRQRQAAKAALLRGTDPVATSEAPEEDEPPPSDIGEVSPPATAALTDGSGGSPVVIPQVSLNPMEALVSAIRETAKREIVFLHIDGVGKIQFHALHVCVNDNTVGIILGKDDFQLDLRMGLGLTLERKGEMLPVVYGGALFTFDRLPVTFLSFFLVRDETENDGEKR